MNAKVKIQLQDHLNPFYTASNLIEAYGHASRTASQLHTLIKQILKNTAQHESHITEELVDSSVFTEIQNLISVSLELADSQLSTYKFEQKKHTLEPSEFYDAGDLLDVYSLAHENTVWLETLLCQIKSEAETLQETVKDHTHPALFSTLNTLIYIAIHLAVVKSNDFDLEREKYETEWEATKNG